MYLPPEAPLLTINRWLRLEAQSQKSNMRENNFLPRMSKTGLEVPAPPRSLNTSCLCLSIPCIKILYVTQTQSDEKLNPKMSQAPACCIDLGFLPFFIKQAQFGAHPGFPSTWEMVLCFPISLCLQIPKVGCIVTIGTNCLLAQTWGAAANIYQRKTTALPSDPLAHPQALGAGWMKPQRGAVCFFPS